MMIRRSGPLAALSVALFLAGCAGNAADVGAAGDSSAAPVSTAPSSPAATSPAPGDAVAIPDAGTTGDPKPTGTTTLSGTVTAGVEPNCLVLTGAGGPHLLIVTKDMAGTVKVGATVTVTGRAAPGMITTCQQGTPFVVTSAAVK